MRNRRRNDLQQKRQSVYWYQTEELSNQFPFNSLPDYHSSHYTRMLIEDVHNGVMPYRSTSKWPCTAHIEPPNPDIEDLLVEAISRRDYRRRLYEVVAEFMHDCTSWMMT